MLASVALILAPVYEDVRDAYPMLVVPFAFGVLLLLELGLRTAATTTFVACALTVVASALGHGPYVAANPLRQFNLLWTGIAVPATAMLLLTSEFGERVRVAAARDASEERFRAAFNHAPLGMAILGFDGRLERVNARLAEMLESDPCVLPGVPVTRFLAPGTRARLARPFDRSPARGETIRRGRGRAPNGVGDLPHVRRSVHGPSGRGFASQLHHPGRRRHRARA